MTKKVKMSMETMVFLSKICILMNNQIQRKCALLLFRNHNTEYRITFFSIRSNMTTSLLSMSPSFSCISVRCMVVNHTMNNYIHYGNKFDFGKPNIIVVCFSHKEYSCKDWNLERNCISQMKGERNLIVPCDGHKRKKYLNYGSKLSNLAS